MAHAPSRRARVGGGTRTCREKGAEKTPGPRKRWQAGGGGTGARPRNLLRNSILQNGPKQIC